MLVIRSIQRFRRSAWSA